MPTGNLDSRSGRVVFDLMRSLSRESGTTFVMVPTTTTSR